MNVSSFVSCIALAMGVSSIVVANEAPCALCETPSAPSVQQVCVAEDAPPSWIFSRSNYTHDPETGARVAQYQRLPVIQPLEDERLVTSRYHRTRTNLRGTNGSQETYYEVQAWGNGRGGLDAEWERFHDAWKESFLQGGYYNQGPGYGNGYNGYPGQFGNGYGNGYGGPGNGLGYPGYGFPGIGNGGPNWGNQGSWQNWNGQGHHGSDGHDHHGDDHDDGHDHGGH